MRKAIGEVPRQREAGTPASVPALLRALQISDKSVEAQKVALRGWLTDHPPSEALRISLRSNGYGVLLGNLGGPKRPMPPITATHKLNA